MIVSKKSKRFQKIFRFYVEHYLLPRHFHSFWWRGKVDAKENLPTIYIANHTSWWDGLLCFLLVEKYSLQDHYMMMEEKQLHDFLFFRKIGAFSINKHKKKSIITSLKYAESLLNKGKSVWIFPQGQIIHQEARPLQFQSGIGYLIKSQERIMVKPVTIQYHFHQYQKPAVSLTIGTEFLFSNPAENRKSLTSYLEQVLTEQLDEHKETVIKDFHYSDYFQNYQQKNNSTSDYYLKYRKWLTKWK